MLAQIMETIVKMCFGHIEHGYEHWAKLGQFCLYITFRAYPLIGLLYIRTIYNWFIVESPVVYIMITVHLTFPRVGYAC